MNNIEMDFLSKYITLMGSLTDQQINKIKNDIRSGKLSLKLNRKIIMKDIKNMKEYILRKPLLNLKRDVPDERDYKLSSVTTEIKTKTDWKMNPVKDQGRLGSCVGFAIAAMKEWQEETEHMNEVEAGKKNHRDEKYYDLSEQWIYYMCKKIDPWPNQEGTSIRVAMKVLHSIGVPTEKAWPYSDKVIGEPKSWAHLVARWSLIDTYYRVDDLNQLKAALLEGPVVIGVPCFEEIFYVGKNGIIAYPKNPNIIYGGHAVCTTGFDDDKQLVKFKNSWGPNWGSNGYGYLPYKYINDFLWDAWAARDLSVTNEMLKGTRELI